MRVIFLVIARSAKALRGDLFIELPQERKTRLPRTAYGVRLKNRKLKRQELTEGEKASLSETTKLAMTALNHHS